MKSILLLTLALVFGAFVFRGDFLDEQSKYERVRSCFSEKGNFIKKTLENAGIPPEELNLLVVAYKNEMELSLYGKKKSESRYKILLTYDICRSSGILGPKKRSGDKQIPEGFYHIDRFNPASTYYLSLGINYPNQADKLKWNSPTPGGDIFIHGFCVTIGCLPMTNEKIKEIYLFAIQARNNGQVEIPVYIFPFKMNAQNLRKYKESYANQRDIVDFWDNLKIGYERFEVGKRELKVRVNNKGNYIFK